MIRYTLKRLMMLIPIAVGVSIVCFSLLVMAPGDPLNVVVPADAPQEVIDQLRIEYGFDRPVAVQYWKWLIRAVQGDLGTSVSTGRPVIAEVAAALGNTVFLALVAFAICIPLGVILGGLAGYTTEYPVVDKVISAFATLGVCVPHYWFGLVLVIVFSVWLQILPAMGAPQSGVWTLSALKYAILPAVTLAMIPTGVIARTTRAVVTEILEAEFILTLRAQGLPARRVGLHVARNAAPTVLAVVGLQFVVLLGGSILIETVFSWPGSGLLLNTAIFQRDMPVLQGTVLVLAILFVLSNLVIDVVQTALDPRIRRA